MLTGEAVVVRAAELMALGMSRKAIDRRCRPGGPWRRLMRGIILLSRAEPTAQHLLRAAVLHGRDDAVVTGLWALRCHGLRTIPEPGEIHVLVPKERSVLSRDFVLVERTRRLPRSSVRHGAPVAPIPRAIADAARRMTERDMIQAMMSDAVQCRRCTPEAIAREVAAGAQPGSRPAREALVPLLAGAWSVAEADAWQLWQRAGLPPCQWNVKVFDADGRYLGTPDAWCDDVAFAWEIDSRKYHSGDDDFARTVARNARYAGAGVVFLQTLPARLRSNPDLVIAELRAAYAAAAARPRPPVHVRDSGR
ncbi:hypothetical protein [Amycolatopsis sp. NPDC059657]|uniref:hypothetical protein n=1 Tax=Amycolatopsis sp. NPDC059657 TaxID=3346899 RepID=UPI00366B9788